MPCSGFAMIDTNLLNTLLSNFLQSSSEITGALIVDVDGLILAQQSVQSLNEAMIGAMMSVLEQTMTKIKRFASTSYGSGTFDTNDFRIFYIELGGQRPSIFVMVCDAYANLERLIPFSYLAAEKASLILHSRSTSAELPNYAPSGDQIITVENGGDFQGKAIKLMMTGQEQVGKSSLVDMYFDGDFHSGYRPTIGVSYRSQDLQVMSQISLRFHVFDLSGMKAFAKVRRFYYTGADLILIMFDYSNMETMTFAGDWLEEAKHFNNNRSCRYLLIGNKIDLISDREALIDTAGDFARERDLQLFNISSKTGEGIDEIFMHVFSLYC